MITIRWSILFLGIACLPIVWPLAAGASETSFLIGRGVADITGPPVGVQMLGYVRPDQIAEGIHLRQYARAFVVAEPADGRRLVIVTTDLQSVTHSMVLSVLDRLQDDFGSTYQLDNTIIAATHTHAVPGGYWQYSANSALGSPFYQEHYDALVHGIVAAIRSAHRDLKPGTIRIGVGEVRGAGAQRSRTAYLNNPEEERSKYPADIDTQMILLRFERDGRAIGMLNWHAVHPTSMSFHNKLISSDNKGYAAYHVERTLRRTGQVDDRFVAAFAQSHCGDVTPNLSLQGTGPGEDEFDSTRIIGGRMAAAAMRIFADAQEEVQGPIDSRHAYVDMGNVEVSGELTGSGPQTTSPAAYGYSFAAGSTEDSGDRPMFYEGMTKTDVLIEALARTITPLPRATERMRSGHRPKPILLAVGAADPPAMPQVLPLGVARIGQIALVVGPAEFTTMSGRRFREAVRQALPGVQYVAVAGYANGYAGYVATREEYELQHYEGASTLFGPWTQAAYQQEFARLAADIAAGRPSRSGKPPLDVRGIVRPTPLGTDYDRLPPDAAFGDVVQEAPEVCQRDTTVIVSFWTGNPRNGYRPDRRYAAIERQVDGEWQSFAVAGDWQLKCRWSQPGTDNGNSDKRAAHQIRIEWSVTEDAQPGTYRVVHEGVFKDRQTGGVRELQTTSRSFEVR